jgi:hypothetical protein
MGGGLMQLVAYGAQDVYLTGQPQITYFKVVYRRHTNFSVEPIQQTFQGNAEFGRTITCNINRNGDLITNMYLVAKIKQDARSNWGYVNKLGYAMIESAKIEVGGSKIDEQYGDWLNVWNELTRNTSHDRANDAMIGNVDALTSLGSTESSDEYTMYVPLKFWFNRNNGLALPLIALQYHDVRVTLKLRCVDDLINYSGSKPTVSDDQMKDAYLLIDYVYLDAEERKRFAQAAHEYLIEQVQFTGDETWGNNKEKYRLNFNHPSKYLVWNTLSDKYTKSNAWVDWAVDGDWEAARERFAKKIWLATRSELSNGATGTGGTFTISLDESTIEIGNGPTAVSLGTNSKVKAILDNIDAQLLFSGSGNNASATLANVVVLRNDVTDAQMAMCIDDIKTDLGTSATEAQDFLVANQVTVRDYFNYSSSPTCNGNPVSKAKLQLNGHDRFTERDGNYFNYVQPYQHFSVTPCDGVNVYSFALKPEDHQPSGTCNFSRIDNTTLNVDFTSNGSGVVKIYCVNYNVFRVMSGMGGLAYSN